MNDKEIIDQIKAIRIQNNLSWKRLIELAISARDNADISLSAKEIIDSIFSIRVRNNVPWKLMMELALKNAPDEAKAALREINYNDLTISGLLLELIK